MEIKEIENFVEQQREQLKITSQVELAKVEGFYKGAEQALSAVGSFINNRQKDEEKPVKKEK